MKWVVAIALVAWFSPAFADGPFCAVTAMGTQCHYGTLSSCRQAIVGIDGACVANPSALAPVAQQGQSLVPRYNAPIVQSPDVLGSFLQGAQAGQQVRQSRAEHESRMRLAEAEIEAIQRQAAEAPPAPLIDTSTGKGLAQACSYVAKVGDQQWAPANEQEMMLGLGFAMECKGFVKGLIGGVSAGPKVAGAGLPFCLDSSVSVHEVATALAAGVSVLPNSADQAAIPYALAVLGARWRCAGP